MANIKIPQTEFPVLSSIYGRWSPRSFSDQAIMEKDLLTLFEAAGWAPSSMNEQPWRYRYASRGAPLFERMHACLLSGNQPWTDKAAVLILNTALTTFERNSNPNRHAYHDCGMANANLFTQATSMNIYGHIMGGYDPKLTIELFQLPVEEEAVCFIALGYTDSADRLEEPFRTRELTPRSRKPIWEVASRV